MSGADVETVRAAILDGDAEHHRLCLSLSGGECDCYGIKFLPAMEALDRLAGRVAEAEKALREIADLPRARATGYDSDGAMGAAPVSISEAQDIARAALSLSPEAVQAGDDPDKTGQRRQSSVEQTEGPPRFVPPLGETSADGAPCPEGDSTANPPCPSCGPGGTNDIHFDRSLCACGAMHYFCSVCGSQTDACGGGAVQAGDAAT